MSMLALTFAVSALGFAQDERGERSRRGRSERETEAAPAPGEGMLAIVGAEVHTVSGAVIRRGTVLVREGKIVGVGQDLPIPEGARRVDARGKVLSPGFVAISVSGIGLRGGGGGGGRGGEEDDEEEDGGGGALADSLDPFDRNIKFALSSGITSGCVQLAAGGRGRRGRNGAPAEYHPGLEQRPFEPIWDLDGDGEEDVSTCSCCGLPILPTEPVTRAGPSEVTARQHAVIKMSYGRLEGMLVAEHAFYDMAAGGLNSAQNRHEWRRDLRRAREALAAREAREEASANASPERGGSRGGGRERGGRGGDPGGRSVAQETPRGGGGRSSASSNPDLERLLKHEVALRIPADTIDEIRDLVELSKELDYRMVIESAIEGWVLASELGEAGVPVIVTPRQRRDPRFGHEDHSGSSIEATGIYEAAGVPFALAALRSSIDLGGIAGRDLMSLPLEGAFAVRGGASEAAALAGLTLVPARMLGLDDRIGSIEVGKDADLLILSGPPLDYRSYVEKAYVSGELAYDLEADGLYPGR